MTNAIMAMLENIDIKTRTVTIFTTIVVTNCYYTAL